MLKVLIYFAWALFAVELSEVMTLLWRHHVQQAP
jgi:hypothetical protein